MSAETRELSGTTSYGKEVSVTTHLSDDQARRICAVLSDRIAQDLARRSTLTPAQLVTLHKFAVKNEKDAPKAVVLKKIREHLNSVKTVQIENTDITLNRCDRGKNIGSVTISNGRDIEDPENRYYGRLLQDGTFQKGRDLNSDVEKALAAAEKNVKNLVTVKENAAPSAPKSSSKKAPTEEEKAKAAEAIKKMREAGLTDEQIKAMFAVAGK